MTAATNTRRKPRTDPRPPRAARPKRSHPARMHRPARTTAIAIDLAPHVAPQLIGLMVPIESIELHPRNPRQGDVAAVAASLRRFGQQKPIVVQASTRFVVAGNPSKSFTP